MFLKLVAGGLAAAGLAAFSGCGGGEGGEPDTLSFVADRDDNVLSLTRERFLVATKSVKSIGDIYVIGVGNLRGGLVFEVGGQRVEGTDVCAGRYIAHEGEAVTWRKVSDTP